MTQRNTSGIRKHNEERQKATSSKVTKAINKLKKNGLFTLQELCDEAGVSRGYFYKNTEMLALAKKYMKPNQNYRTRNEDTQEALIYRQKQEIKKLKSQIEKLNKEAEKEESYKTKYEKALEENQRLNDALNDKYASEL